MYIQRELRTKNIAEYLLYMWQVEDMIRAAGLNSDHLYKSIISVSGRSESECREWQQWYDDLIAMMRSEGKCENGHIQINENVLIMLSDLHLRILNSDKQPKYRELFYKALPFIVEFRAKRQSGDNNEIHDCFDLLYGVWMLKIQNKPVGAATAQAVEVISAFIGELALLYNQERECRLELD